jgi:two-component system sensor histidine kinase ChvG
MGAGMFHGIRFRLAMAALVLLALPWLAAQFITHMEDFLRDSQAHKIGDTARAIAAALSDRPALFRAANDPADRAAEERRRIIALFAAADPDTVASLGSAYAPSEEIERLLAVMGRPASRLWVVDAGSRVRGLYGSLRDERDKREMSGWLRPIAGLVAPPPRLPAGDESEPARGQVERALIGVSSVLWRGTRDRDVAVLSAAQPIFVGDDIVGAIVLEETTASIQLLRNDALERLLAVTLAIVAASLVILLAFSTRLVARIRKLHAEAESAIDAQGRVRGTITPSAAQDEIGDLTRTTAAMLARLRDYNAYLEAMAGRLSHELRTPLAVVRSSLDNLKSDALPSQARVYVERAGEGVERLARIISRLSEATRLEQLLASGERERFDLAKLVAACVEGYRSAYPERAFELAVPSAPLWMTGVPDAIAEALDKLVENANDFAPPASAVRMAVEPRGRRAVVAVENEGPALPPDKIARLFESMVSLRAGEAAGTQPHLGLGLYIARLVAEFHGGTVRASNLAESGRVRFEIEAALME